MEVTVIRLQQNVLIGILSSFTPWQSYFVFEYQMNITEKVSYSWGDICRFAWDNVKDNYIHLRN